MRNLAPRELPEISGGDLYFGYDEERRMETVTVTGRRVESFASHMALFGITDLNELIYGPNGQPPLPAADVSGFTFIVDPNASDAAWDALGATQGLDGELLESIWENSQPGDVVEAPTPGPLYPSAETWGTFIDLFPWVPPNWRDFPSGPPPQNPSIDP